MVEDGRLKVLAVTSTQRAAELPDKPTIAESGYPNYETSYWIGVLGPAGLPPDIVAKLQQAFTAAAKDRSEERRVGKECGSTCRSRWSPYHEKNKTNKKKK